MNRTITGLLGAGATFALLAATIVIGSGQASDAIAGPTHSVAPTGTGHGGGDDNQEHAKDKPLINMGKNAPAGHHGAAMHKAKPHHRGRHHHHRHHHRHHHHHKPA